MTERDKRYSPHHRATLRSAFAAANQERARLEGITSPEFYHHSGNNIIELVNHVANAAENAGDTPLKDHPPVQEALLRLRQFLSDFIESLDMLLEASNKQLNNQHIIAISEDIDRAMQGNDIEAFRIAVTKGKQVGEAINRALQHMQQERIDAE